MFVITCEGRVLYIYIFLYTPGYCEQYCVHILTVKNKEETKLLLMIACDLQSF